MSNTDITVAMTEGWSLGVWIGLPITVLLLLICLAWIAFATIGIFASEKGDRAFAVWGVVGGVAVALVIAAVAGFMFWPWQKEYHYWQPVTGQVAKIESRLLPAGDGMQEKFVVKFADGRERGCVDTRYALVKVGDTLTITCKRSYQWFGQPGWDCNYVSNNASTS